MLSQSHSENTLTLNPVQPIHYNKKNRNRNQKKYAQCERAFSPPCSRISKRSPWQRNYDENKFSPRNNPHFLHNSRIKRVQMYSRYILIYYHSFCGICFPLVNITTFLSVHCQTLVTVPEFGMIVDFKNISKDFTFNLKYLWQKKREWIQEGIWGELELDGVKLKWYFHSFAVSIHFVAGKTNCEALHSCNNKTRSSIFYFTKTIIWFFFIFPFCGLSIRESNHYLLSLSKIDTSWKIYSLKCNNGTGSLT